jgi:hypothetical protein
MDADSDPREEVKKCARGKRGSGANSPVASRVECALEHARYHSLPVSIPYLTLAVDERPNHAR